MKITEPTVVYRGMDFASVERLAEHLRASGIDARVAVPDPVTATWFPMFETHHELLATDYDEAEIQELIARWEASGAADHAAAPPPVGLYCYHCGAPLTAPTNRCPTCQATLD